MKYIIMCVLLFVSASGCATDTVSRSDDQSATIALELQQCPDWTEVAKDEAAKREKITNIYIKLSKYDTNVIKNGIIIFMEKTPFPLSIEADMKAYAFLRVFFAIPETVVPYDDLWPYSMNKDGRLVLTGVDTGRGDLPNESLIEFDPFLSQYGRRYPVSIRR